MDRTRHRLTQDTDLMFYVFEGTDGAGKTTVAELFAEHIGGILLKTPPAILSGIRDQFEVTSLEARCLYYLLSTKLVSDQAEVELQRYPVICDRYYFTTLVAHICLGLKRQWVERLIADIGFLEPDRVFFVDCEDRERSRRLEIRGKSLQDIRHLGHEGQMRQIITSIPGVIQVDSTENTPEMILEFLLNHI